MGVFGRAFTYLSVGILKVKFLFRLQTILTIRVECHDMNLKNVTRLRCDYHRSSGQLLQAGFVLVIHDSYVTQFPLALTGTVSKPVVISLTFTSKHLFLLKKHLEVINFTAFAVVFQPV
jgi:hypothetical protein